MDRAIVIAFAALGIAIAAAIGAGLGFAYLARDPVNLARQQCAAMHCVHFAITGRSTDRVEYTYDTPDGSHCAMYAQTLRGGPFGLLGGSRGGGTCVPAGQSLPLPGHPMTPPTPFPDGNPPCSAGPMTLSGPFPTTTGFEIRATNAGTIPCDVEGRLDLQFLPLNGPPLSATEQAAAGEPVTPVALAPGATASFQVDNGPPGPACQGTGRMLILGPVAGPPAPPSS